MYENKLNEANTPEKLFEVIRAEIEWWNDGCGGGDCPQNFVSLAAQAAVRIRAVNQQFDLPSAPNSLNIVDIQNWCVDADARLNKPEKGTLDDLDDLDKKIIELYQLAESKNMKPPGGALIAKTLYDKHITATELSKEAINKRVRRLRTMDLIGTKPHREEIQSDNQISDNSETHKMKF